MAIYNAVINSSIHFNLKAVSLEQATNKVSKLLGQYNADHLFYEVQTIDNASLIDQSLPIITLSTKVNSLEPVSKANKIMIDCLALLKLEHRPTGNQYLKSLGVNTEIFI